MMQVDEQQRNDFLEVLWRFYDENGRDLPWRQPDQGRVFNPYKIMVSELMLQQTQVSRVLPKYEAFLRQFPNVRTLATADLGDVLRAWQGLGYNRRAKFLWQAAQAIEKPGTMPDTHDSLVQLPGIGSNTAGAILAYAYNQPAIFIETNVRTVYIHHFFANEVDVMDKTIAALLEQTIDNEHPREFYWALMDYGSHLKATIGNLNRASKHYAKQSSFKGSRRQIRGHILRLLGQNGYTLQDLQSTIEDDRVESVLQDLLAESLVRTHDGMYVL
jgi:A/G-specific adenine glycosylase